jgi:hypothetical protein
MLRCWKHNPGLDNCVRNTTAGKPQLYLRSWSAQSAVVYVSHVTFTFSLFHHIEVSVTRFIYMLNGSRCIAINAGPPYASVNSHELIQISQNIEQLDDIQQTHLLPLFQPRIRSYMNQILIQNFFLSLYL